MNTIDRIVSQFERREAAATKTLEGTRALVRDYVAQGNVQGERLEDLARDLTTAETRFQIWTHLRKVAAHGEDLAQITDTIVSMLLAGADDTWSGRGNDRQRVVHEARISVAREAYEVLTYGA